jgi:hypothetical protein
MVWVLEDFDHVVAGAEAELLQGHLERHGARSSETRPDNVQTHDLYSPSANTYRT